MDLTPDSIIVFTVGGVRVNATIVYTWLVMAVLTGGAWLMTRNLRPDVPPNRWRTLLEVIVQAIEGQIAEIAEGPARHVLYFSGTLFLFILTSNVLSVVPGFRAPTGSLSTTAGLALAVLVAVPIFGIGSRGLTGYLRTYVQPSWIMLPFNIIGEISRGLSLAIRLYGNIMSGAVIAAILLGVAPLFFPVLMSMLSLLTGVIQAYIFAVLATVYIASATADPTRTATKGEKSS
ncbi:MAG: F0F1 ATP synthase subunit A [Burkholderiales bacterium]|nr:F0F1 ATP synthase subunit A [Burkholderiales bacterium]